jgi:cyclopropane fatty-acyl-phospholipid synthase-like methyltransferase
MDLPHSEACERNKVPILAELQPRWGSTRRVFEIGSGTGQHAVFFAQAMPGWIWQCSDVPAHLPSLRQRIDAACLPNLPEPLAWDVNQPRPSGGFDAVFTANTLHIMGWAEVQRLFDALAALLVDGGIFSAYGPFNDAGRFTSDSNARFDAALRAADPRRGIRDLRSVDALAQTAGLRLLCDSAMPANNRCVSWQREVLR